MKILFITLLEGIEWGGSELLWFKLLEKLALSNEISLSCTQPMFNSSRIKALNQRKIKLIQRRGRLHRTTKITNKFCSFIPFFFLKKIYGISKQTDLMIISLPSLHGLRLHKTLIYVLAQLEIPFIIICQWNSDFGNIYNQKSVSKIFSKAKNIFFVSEANLLSAKRQFISDFNNAQTILNPLNIDSSDYITFPKNEIKQIACVARLDCNFKAQDLLIEALNNLKHLKNWHLNIYGEGIHEDYLKALVQFYSLSDRISFKGFSLVKDIWKHNEILVLPSISEGTPLALVEAMMLGRPAIITNIAGMPEWIKHNCTGFIIPSLNIIDIKNTIKFALVNQERWEKMGQSAREQAIAKRKKSLTVKQLAIQINLNE
jgi:glycosyltransferase involved in cell wall biosynthesis